MLLLAITLAFSVIHHLKATTQPNLSESSFKELLETCTKIENSNSKDCQYFISTYRWLYDDVHLVFDKILTKSSPAGSPNENVLEARMIDLIQSPNFDYKSLGINPMKRAIERHHDPLATAIWPHLKNYKNDSSDLQLQVCRNNMSDIIYGKMLQLLSKMLTDRPDCLQQVRDPIELALRVESELPTIVLLNEHGAEIEPDVLALVCLPDNEDIIEWAVRKYPSLLLKSISEGYLVSLTIWKFLKRENYSNLLLQICNETIIHAVNSNLDFLVIQMYKDFPECILSKGDILMDIAIRGGMNTASMLPFLNERGVEITPGLVLRDPRHRQNSGYRDMILLLNDIGVKITPGQLQHLSTYDDIRTFEWARLHSQLSRETFINSPIKHQYFKQAILSDLHLLKKLLDMNAVEIEMIEEVLAKVYIGEDVLNLLLSHIRSKRITNCNDTIIHAVNSNIRFLVKAIQKEFPECILSKGDILMHIAIRGGMNIPSMISFLNDRGVEITPGLVLRDPVESSEFGYRDMILFLNDVGVKITTDHFQPPSLYENTETFKYARLNSQLSRETFVTSSIKDDFFDMAVYHNRFDAVKKILDLDVIEIEKIEKMIFEPNCDYETLDLLRNYVRGKRVKNCNDTIIHAVNSNLAFLVETIHKEFPECILSKGDILMHVAIRGGMKVADMISFLNERGVKITPGLVLKDPRQRQDSGYRDMILFLNDIGVKITPEHLQHLSTYRNTKTLEWARLNSHLSKETFISSPIKKAYFVKAIENKRSDLIKKILDFNVFEIEELEIFIYNYGLDEHCLDLLKSHVRDKKEKNCIA